MTDLISFRQQLTDIPDRLSTVAEVAIFACQEDPTIVDARFMHLLHASQQRAPTDLASQHRITGELTRLVLNNDAVAARLASLMALFTKAKYGHGGYFPTPAELQSAAPTG